MNLSSEDEKYAEDVSFLGSLHQIFESMNARGHLKELWLREDERLAHACRRYFRTKRITLPQYRMELTKLLSREVESFYNEVFKDCPFELGKELSTSYPEDSSSSTGGGSKAIAKSSLNYGEIEFNAFFEILMNLEKMGFKSKNKVFYDLGSGTAKPLVIARLLQDYRKLVGIEIVGPLFAKGCQMVNVFESNYLDSLAISNSILQRKASLLDIDWSDGDVVFCNSTAFDDNLMERMSHQAKNLKPDTIFITFTKSLDVDTGDFQIVLREKRKMSWGYATIFYHRKL